MAQMTDHMLNPERGYPPGTSLLTFDAKISALVLFTMPPGRCGHLNDSGEIEPGVVREQMPLFGFQGAADLDVSDPAAGSGAGADWWTMSPSGNVTWFVGKGPFELGTTEFDTAQTYLPNQ